MHTFYVRKLLTTPMFKEARDLYKKTPSRHMYQDYSLFNVEKSNIRPGYTAHCLKALDKYMKDRYGVIPDTHYFLKYPQWSWTRVHTDNIGTSTKTIITFLEQSVDLLGGETLIYDKHYDLPVPKGQIVQRSGSVHRMAEVPFTPKVKDGESLIYDSNTRHGVTMIQRGYRIVLVSWYKT